jgi:hypothetical protein
MIHFKMLFDRGCISRDLAARVVKIRTSRRELIQLGGAIEHASSSKFTLYLMRYEVSDRSSYYYCNAQIYNVGIVVDIIMG